MEKNKNEKKEIIVDIVCALVVFLGATLFFSFCYIAGKRGDLVACILYAIPTIVIYNTFTLGVFRLGDKLKAWKDSKLNEGSVVKRSCEEDNHL